MWPESAEQNPREQAKPLRSGLTTGCCATACAVAAGQYLLSGRKADCVSVKLPRGNTVQLSICDWYTRAGGASAATIKDAGDDPDVTHGAKVFVELSLQPVAEIVFRAGKGVGTVTREGLALAVGEPAINPVPRQMMVEHLQQLAAEYQYCGGFEVTVGVEGGEQLALKTMNPRLGILGGLSVLGTTGIVRPFSCAAYIASIHQGIDVARANGYQHIAATTGSSSEAAIRTQYSLPEMALIEMGDFVGAVLKYLKKAPVKKLSLCGGFGKISKLANGHMDLHSRASSIDLQQLADLAVLAGADQTLARQVLASNTSIEALKLCQLAEVDLAAAVCRAAWQKTRAVIPTEISLEVWAINRQGELIACAKGAEPPGRQLP